MQPELNEEEQVRLNALAVVAGRLPFLHGATLTPASRARTLRALSEVDRTLNAAARALGLLQMARNAFADDPGLEAASHLVVRLSLASGRARTYADVDRVRALLGVGHLSHSSVRQLAEFINEAGQEDAYRRLMLISLRIALLRRSSSLRHHQRLDQQRPQRQERQMHASPDLDAFFPLFEIVFVCMGFVFVGFISLAVGVFIFACIEAFLHK